MSRSKVYIAISSSTDCVSAAIYKMLIDLKLFSSVANIFEGNDHDIEKLVLDEITLSSNYGRPINFEDVFNSLLMVFEAEHFNLVLWKIY